MRPCLSLAAVAALAFAAPALAQTQPTASPQEAGASAAITEDEVTKFAQATVKVHALGQPTPEQLVETVTASGLTVDRYNEISAAMRSDPALQQQINAQLIRAQGQSAGTSGTNSPPPTAASAPLPPLPTAGPGGAILRVLNEVCLPMVEKDVPVADVGKRIGLKRNRRDGSFQGSLGQDGFSVTVFPRGANQAVCSVEISHPLGADEDLAKALTIWSAHQQPVLRMVRNDVGTGADGLRRTTLSWEGANDSGSAALVFVRVERADGAPLQKGVGSANLLYSERPA